MISETESNVQCNGSRGDEISNSSVADIDHGACSKVAEDGTAVAAAATQMTEISAPLIAEDVNMSMDEVIQKEEAKGSSSVPAPMQTSKRHPLKHKLNYDADEQDPAMTIATKVRLSEGDAIISGALESAEQSSIILEHDDGNELLQHEDGLPPANAATSNGQTNSLPELATETEVQECSIING